jgi:hypothetical protein
MRIYMLNARIYASIIHLCYLSNQGVKNENFNFSSSISIRCVFVLSINGIWLWWFGRVRFRIFILLR